MKYLLSRNDTSYIINGKLRNHIPIEIERFNTIDCIHNINEEKVSMEDDIFISSLMDKLKHKRENDDDIKMGTTSVLMKNIELKLFLPEKMNELRTKVQLKLGDPFIYLNKSLRTEKIIKQTSVMSNIFKKNVENISNLFKRKITDISK